MTTPTIGSNGHMQRKSLANQLDRLDGILDGLTEALAESVADAVKDAVGRVVREAVQAAVKEVISRAEMVRTVPEKPVPPSRNQPDPARASHKLGQTWTWLLEKLRIGCCLAHQDLSRFLGFCVDFCNALSTVGGSLWRFRRTCVIVLSVALACGIGNLLTHPVISAVLFALGGGALAVSAMILIPLGRLLQGARV